MKAMRQGTKPVLWIIIAAFVGTIIFAWGMDFTAQSTAKGIIAKVNGEELRLDDYSYLYQNALAQQQRQRGDVTDDDANRLREEVFDQMVGSQLMRQTTDKIGLKVTNAELAEHLRRFPPQEIRTLDMFVTNGQFDYNKYLAAYQNPDPQLWLQIEALVRPRVLQQKLFEYVTTTTVIDDSEVKELYDAAGEKIRVRYILVPSQAYLDSVPAADTATAEAWYKDHREEFRHGERARIKYVQFDKKPSAEDSAEVRREAEQIAQQARSGADFTSLVQQYSEDNSSPTGDLGWFGKGRMVKPFEDVAFTLDSGQVSDPVATRFGIHVIKSDGRRGIGDSIQIKAFHVLLKVEPSSGTLSDLRLKAEQFAEDMKSEPSDTLARLYGTTVRLPGFFERGQDIPLMGKQPAIAEWVFSSKPGAISDVFETTPGFVVVQTESLEPEGYAPFAEVAPRIISRLRTDDAKNQAAFALDQVLPRIQAGASLWDIAPPMGRKVDSTATAFGRYESVPGIGDDAVFRGAAFALAKSGQSVSQVVKVGRGAVVMQIIDRTTADPQRYVEKRDSIMSSALENKKQMLFQQWYEKLRADADVQDYRYQLPGEY
jgi:parvulin-like peptidyl-prolyl isomerase